jgi:hypothetical protein
LTEIPEHLLKRSKAAKGGGKADSSGEAADSSASSTPVAAAASTPATPAADLPNLDPPPPPPKPVASYVQAALDRKKIPLWAVPIVATIPLWAFFYAGTMQQPETEDILIIDAELAYAGCAGCHGGNGGGGTGYAFADGEILATFPTVVDQMVHVARGSAAIAGQPYGDPNRAGGGRIAGALGVMPAQENALTRIELEMVIFHERAILGGEDTSSAAYQEWMEHMREVVEGPEADLPIDDEYLEFLLACANPEYTPGATGTGSPDPEMEPCPGPHAEEEGGEVAAGE